MGELSFQAMKLRIVGFLIIFLFSAESSHAFRCKGILVVTGDSKELVLGKCGKPLLTEHWTIEKSKKLQMEEFIGKRELEKNEQVKKRERVKREWEALAPEYITRLEVDLWTYNLGPENFTPELTFENGLLISETHGNYGYKSFDPAKRQIERPRTCTYTLISRGTKKIDLLAGCGAPTGKELLSDIKVISRYTNSGTIFWKERRSNSLERWTYNFGPKNFIYQIKIMNGTIVSYSTEGYGYR